MSSKTSLLKISLSAMCLCMIYVTVATSLKQNLMGVLPRMIHDPWTLATFIDFYFNMLLLSGRMAYKEGSAGRALAWFVSFIALGSIATSFYVLVQVWKLRPGDRIEKLWVRS